MNDTKLGIAVLATMSVAGFAVAGSVKIKQKIKHYNSTKEGIYGRIKHNNNEEVIYGDVI